MKYLKLFILLFIGCLAVSAAWAASGGGGFPSGPAPTATPTPTPTPYDPTIEADLPLGFWPLSDTVGSTTAVDLSGHGHNCTTAGTAPTFGVTGDTADGETAASFSAGWLSCPMPAPTITNGFTIEFLMKSTGGTVTGVIDTNPSQGGTLRNFDTNNAISPQNTGIPVAFGSTGAWHLIDVHGTYESNGTVVYLDDFVDGATVTNGSAAPTNHNSAGGRSAPTWGNPMVWGAINASCGVACYSGTLQKLAIYGYWLTPTQIKNHFNAISVP